MLTDRQRAAYDAGLFVCNICDGGNANHCACSCSDGPCAPPEFRHPYYLNRTVEVGSGPLPVFDASDLEFAAFQEAEAASHPR